MKCPIDHREFKNKHSLASHMRWHKGLMSRDMYVGINIESRNGMWKGDDVGYCSLHEWVKNRKPKPNFCENCHQKKPYDLANISGQYKRDVSDYEWLCRSCHVKKDGRLKNLLKGPNLNLKRDSLGRFLCLNADSVEDR